MPFETAFHSATRRLASGVRKVCLDHTRSPFSVSPPSIADRKSSYKRRHWMGAALCTLSTAMGRIGLLDYERELLYEQLHSEWGTCLEDHTTYDTEKQRIETLRLDAGRLTELDQARGRLQGVE